MTLDQTFQLAIQHHQAGRLPEAENLYRKVLAQRPDHPDALHYLGMIAAAHAQWPLAIDLCRRSIALSPNKAHFHSNLGACLISAGRLAEAIPVCQNAVKLAPNDYNAHFNLGCALQGQEQSLQAIAAFNEVLRLNPNHPDALNNLGKILKDSGQVEKSITLFRRAIQFRPNFWGAYRNLGNALADLGLLDEALAAFDRATALNPNDPTTPANRLFNLHFHPAYDAAAILEEHRRWDRRYAHPLKHLIRPHDNDRSPDRPLRVGYVAPYFRSHAVASCFLLQLLTHHNPKNVDVYCYSAVANPDSITAQFQSLGFHWRDIALLSDDQLDAQIRLDKIDILVDLTLHMEGSRLLVFARKPAPIQANWAYPATSGLDTIDYRLTDPYLDPPGETDRFYSEKSLRLPRTFWCYKPMVQTPAPNSLPALQNGHLTFGCFNNLCKVTPPTLQLWSKVLHAIPHSRMLLLTRSGEFPPHIRQAFSAAGIDPQRIEAVPFQPSDAYFQLYHRVDLCLDPIPYPGHTSAMDGAWMGVPAVTLAGNTAASRGGVSILSNLNLLHLIAHSPEQYLSIAQSITRDLPALARLRSSLRQTMLASPLLDAPQFARDTESAYRHMWQAWCSSPHPPI